MARVSEGFIPNINKKTKQEMIQTEEQKLIDLLKFYKSYGTPIELTLKKDNRKIVGSIIEIKQIFQKACVLKISNSFMKIHLQDIIPGSVLPAELNQRDALKGGN